MGRRRRPTRRPSRSTAPCSSRPPASSCPPPSPRSTAAARWRSPASTSPRSRRSTTTRHLFQERTLRSVTANTREDGDELLRLAAEIPIRPHTVPFRLEDANDALRQLKHDGFEGAAVLQIG